ncbi:hypothetical protein Taro_021696 [Colocasia esculenta]|uniref:Pentatricopeptide repeat-containing protein n=1 Tax=Colocasia esculenta TaxID=4460 RepID=A0A843V1Y2_COLES|nr:hypothetical protein [Colocasia esculenta]
MSSPSLGQLLHRYRRHRPQLDQVHALLTTTGYFCCPSDPSLPPEGEASDAGATFVYNILIGASTLRREPCRAALHLLAQMLVHRVPPNRHTFPPLIKSIAISVSASPFSPLPGVAGQAVHAQVSRRGLVPDDFVNCCMVKFYGQLGDLGSAGKVFEENPRPDVASLNAVLDALCKNGDVGSATRIFDGLRERDVVSWTTLINGFLVNGCFEEAIHFFREMMLGSGQGASSPRPNEATLVCVLSACANSDSSRASHQGREIHGYVVGHDVQWTAFLGTALIDMYGKRGRVHCAANVFERMVSKEVCTWNAMISALASNGEEARALDMFEMMRIQGMRPNGITFIAVLTACARSRVVQRGLGLFESMCCDHEIVPTMEHYGCVVDLFGKAGLFEKALEFIRAMPFEPDASVWGALLGACKMHGNVQLAAEIGTRLLTLQPHHSGRYMVLSNIYAGEGMWGTAFRFCLHVSSYILGVVPVEPFILFIENALSLGTLGQSHGISLESLTTSAHESKVPRQKLLLEMEPRVNFLISGGRHGGIVASVITVPSSRGLMIEGIDEAFKSVAFGPGH